MNYDTTLKIECRDCGGIFEVKVNQIDYNKYLEGELIQRALPYLSSDDRELILSSTCHQCWNDTFVPDDYMIREALEDMEQVDRAFPPDEI